MCVFILYVFLQEVNFCFVHVHFSFCKDIYSLMLFLAFLTHRCALISIPAAACKSSLYLLAAEHSI